MLSETGLESLVTQGRAAAGHVEILLLDGRRSGPGKIPLRVDSSVRVIRAPEAPSLPNLLARGIAQAKGRLVATTEAHVRLASDWVERALHLPSSEGIEAAAVGGAVEPGEGLGPRDWALFFCDYAQFLLPFEAKRTSDLPGCNVIFARRVLDRSGDFTRSGFWKTFFCRDLEAQGELLRVDPELVAYYYRSLPLGRWLRRRYAHGRCFGGMRAERISVIRRLLIATAGPALPWILLGQLVRRLWPKDRYRRRFLAVVPLCFLADAVWAVGEWVGNAWGAGASCREV